MLNGMYRNWVGMLAGAIFLGTPLAQASPADKFETNLKPFLKATCVGCHSGGKPSGGLDLNRFLSLDAAGALADRDQWERVLEKLTSGEMPPAGIPRPSAEVTVVREWVAGELARLDRD